MTTNQDIIMMVMEFTGPVSVGTLGRLTGINPAAISKCMRSLQRYRMVEEAGVTEFAPKRFCPLWRLTE